MQLQSMRCTYLWPLVVILLLVLASFSLPVGSFSIDEGAYYWVTKQLVESGKVSLENGFPEYGRAFEVHGSAPLVFWVQDKLHAAYPIGHAIIAGPFYATLGYAGFYLLNLLSVFLILILVAHRAAIILEVPYARMMFMVTLILAPPLALAAMAVWPHALMSLLLFAAYLLYFPVGPYSSSGRSNVVASILSCLAIWVRYDSLLVIVAFGVILLTRGRVKDLVILAVVMVLSSVGLAWVNFEKFGVFFPFVYGPDAWSLKSSLVHGRYAILAGGLAILALYPLSRPSFKSVLEQFLQSKRRVSWAIAILLVIGLLLVLPEQIRGIYSILFHFRAGTELRYPILSSVPFIGGTPDPLYGTFKLALFQLAPVLTIGLGALLAAKSNISWQFRVEALAVFSTLAIFYGLREWHGGTSFEMRYLYPAVPFLGLATVLALIKTHSVQTWLFNPRSLTLVICTALLLSLLMNSEILLLDLTTLVALALLSWILLGKPIERICLSLIISFGLAIVIHQSVSMLAARFYSERQVDSIVGSTTQNDRILVITDAMYPFFPSRESRAVDIMSIKGIETVLSQGLLAKKQLVYSKVMLCCPAGLESDLCVGARELLGNRSNLELLEMPDSKCWRVIPVKYVVCD